MSTDAQAILKAHLGELPGSIEAVVEGFLQGLTPYERIKGRTVVEACDFAALSRSELYRAIERGELAVERAEAPPRRNGRRAATKIVVTFVELARLRARRRVAAVAPIEETEGGR